MKRYILFITCFVQQMTLLAREAGVVVYLVNKMKAGQVSADHPWATGLDPEDGTPIWPKNIVYRSPSKLGFSKADDELVITRVGQFLRSMVKRSVPSEPEIPQSQKRRMPHAVNYIHGAVHFNGAFAVFDDFEDLIFHVTDPEFRADFKRFVRAEKREITLVLRDRDIDPTEYAYCVAAMRAYLPYFTNGNGPTPDPVLWGNKAPYAALNPINGAWKDDMLLLNRGKVAELMRPAISELHFQTAYTGVRRGFTRIEKFTAWLMFLDVRARGSQGQTFFTRRKNYDAKGLEEYKALGYWRWFNVNRVPKPTEAPRGAIEDFSIIIPTLNEESNLGACLQSVRASFGDAEIIIADGGSTDSTCEIAESFGARVIHPAPGRGPQQRAGASAATGEVLVFLHADCRVGPHTARRLRRHFNRSESNQVCTMRLRFPRKNPLFAPLGWVTRLDGYWFSYGDQGIVCRRSFYDAIGGIPDQPLFEDVEFFKRARRVTRVSSVRTRITASDRRFARNGLVKELWSNTKLLRLYAQGASPDRLNAIYRKGWSTSKTLAKAD